MRWISFVIMVLWAGIAGADTVRLAVTTSFHDSGLADVLLPEIAADTGIDVQMLVVGTGQALRLGRAGDVDAIMVHSKAAEETFVADGYGTYRMEIMYNDFIILGPSADAADIAKSTTASQAFARIADARATFVSRGDDSGTHQTELRLWRAAGLNPDASWYKSVGAGMGAALNTAAGLGAYILSDRATWLNFGNAGDLTVLFEGDPALFNQYSLIPISPARHAHVKRALVAQLETWLTSAKAADLINGYRLQGQPLFVFNAARASAPKP